MTHQLRPARLQRATAATLTAIGLMLMMAAPAQAQGGASPSVSRTFKIDAQFYLPFPKYIPPGFIPSDVRVFNNNEIALDYTAPKIDRYGAAELWFQEYVSSPAFSPTLCSALRSDVTLHGNARAVYCVYYDGSTALYGLFYKAVNLEDQPTWIWEQINYPHKPGSSVDLRQWEAVLVKIANSVMHDGWSLSTGAP